MVAGSSPAGRATLHALAMPFHALAMPFESSRSACPSAVARVAPVQYVALDRREAADGVTEGVTKSGLGDSRATLVICCVPQH